MAQTCKFWKLFCYKLLTVNVTVASNIMLQITLFAQIENDFCRKEVWLMLELDFTHNWGC